MTDELRDAIRNCAIWLYGKERVERAELGRVLRSLNRGAFLCESSGIAFTHDDPMICFEERWEIIREKQAMNGYKDWPC